MSIMEPRRPSLPPYQPPPPTGRQLEPLELKYARQTRTAVAFLAILAGVVFLLSAVGWVIVGIQVGKVSSELNNGSSVSTSSNCQPGSVIPGC
jgi:hypothetical protein